MYIPLRVKIRTQLRKFLPVTLFAAISFVWINTLARFFKVQDILQEYTRRFLKTHPKIVHSGPFTGMKYVDQAVGSNYLHKLIGSYEAVLHPVLDSIKGREYDTIIDIGAAEGYYLIGLGQMFPAASLIGFESDETGRALAKKLYELNGLQNQFLLKGEATAANVHPYVTSDTLLVCDCEGAEVDILDPSVYPSYREIKTAIIELHDHLRPGLKKILMERFALTHKITVVRFRPADPNDFPFLSAIKNKRHLYEISRERGWQEQEWLVLEKFTS